MKTPAGVRRVEVVYLDQIIRGVALQIGINVTLHRLQQATVAEAHQERVVGVALFHHGGQLDDQALWGGKKKRQSKKILDLYVTS